MHSDCAIYPQEYTEFTVNLRPSKLYNQQH